MIQIALLLYSSISGLGCRGVQRVIACLQSVLNIDKVPHFTTIRQWVLKRGHSQIVHRNFANAKDWMSIIDLTVGVGALKCLLVLGVRFSHLQKSYSNDYTLSHDHVQVLGLYITENSTGKFVQESLEDAEKKVGHPFAAVLADQGSDVKKGANSYAERSGEIVVVHDISHKMSNVLEKELKENAYWKKFCECLATTKQSVQQTRDLAALMPPKLRSKARYMSVDVLMDWVTRFETSKELGHMNSICKERLDKYFGWLDPLKPHIKCWKEMVTVVETVKKAIRIQGYSHEVYDELEKKLRIEYKQTSNLVMNFIESVLNIIWDEIRKLKPKRTVIGDGRVIESIFGKFKQSPVSQLQGVTIGALGIATFMANNDSDDIRKSMETSRINDVLMWGEKNIKRSVASLRRKFFPHKKKE